MRTMCVVIKNHFKRLQIVILHLALKETGAKHLAIAINSRCHSISLVMYVFGAKFEEHCSNISGDICDSVLFKWNYLHIQCHQNSSFA